MKTIFLRLIDQASWSGAFFLGNMWVAFSLSIEEFAASTVATSIGVIFAAICRAYALDARIVVSSRLGHNGLHWFSSKISTRSTIVFASGAWLFTLLWLSVANTPHFWKWSFLALLIVAADIPHYGLVLRGQKSRALLVSMVYSGGIVSLWGFQLFDPFTSWIATLLFVVIVSAFLSGRIHSRISGLESRSTARHMSAEALYAALAGQIGILVLYLVADSEATAGIRLTYSLVFAPVFLVIQGLFPLLLRNVIATSRKTSNSRSLLGLWVLGASASLIAIAILAFVISISQASIAPTLALTIPFLLPVGLSMVGSLALDAGLLRLRLNAPPGGPHRLRLVLTLIDILLQFPLVILASIEGLILALAIGGIIKLIVGIIIFIKRFDLPRFDSAKVEYDK